MSAPMGAALRRCGAWPVQTLGLSALCLIVHAQAGPAPDAWIYDRTAVEAGEFWRLLTGHWVHTDLGHLAWNASALFLLGWLFEARLGYRLLPIVLLATGTIDAWLWWGLPSLTFYCGASALLNTLLAVGLWWGWQRDRSVLSLAVGVCWLGKTLAEMITGDALFTRTAWVPVPSAHAIGLATGLIVAVLLKPIHLPRVENSTNLCARNRSR